MDLFYFICYKLELFFVSSAAEVILVPERPQEIGVDSG
jgi:hypothetical protein